MLSMLSLRSVARARTPHRLHARLGLAALAAAAVLLTASGVGSLREGEARRDPVPGSRSVAFVTTGAGAAASGFSAGSAAPYDLATP
jgi:hypothetical protein